MKEKDEFTYHASPQRSSQEQINYQHSIVNTIKNLPMLLESLSEIALIINENRQIVYSNGIFLNLFGIKDLLSLIGKRAGEACGCIHSSDNENGCGTSEACQYCGLVNAVLSSQTKDEKFVTECRITTKIDKEKEGNTSLDLQVTVSPLRHEGQKYSIVTITDISGQKRRIAMERIFFHDVMNTAGGIKGLVELVLTRQLSQEKMEEFLLILDKSSKNLIDEITSYKNLSLAENNELVVQFVAVNSVELLNDIKDLYLSHDVAKSKTLIVENFSETITFTTDLVLIKRILGNLVKNALEASKKEATVTLSCRVVDDMIQFCVHNSSFIPHNVQLQIFQRSFSTKGNNRGLGTYSIKLLTEKYLKGQVRFETSSENGTDFYIQLPLGMNEK